MRAGTANAHYHDNMAELLGNLHRVSGDVRGEASSGRQHVIVSASKLDAPPLVGGAAGSAQGVLYGTSHWVKICGRPHPHQCLLH